MKKILKSLLFVFASVAILMACDKIDEPYLKPSGQTGGDDTTTAVRKILLEDFTGHKCTNCPAAAILAKSLTTQYPGRIITIGVHAGYFAKADQIGDFKANYTNATSEELYTFYGVEANPAGLINRMPTDGQVVFKKDQWETLVNAELAKEAEASIALTAEYNESTRLLNVKANVKALKDLSGLYNIVFALIEDSLISPQKNIDAFAGATPIIEKYVHMHVLRCHLNGTFGAELNSSDGITTGTVISKTASITIGAEWKAKNIKLVAYVINRGSDKLDTRVIQAEEIEIVE
ncbi:MAG TPA: Omp28-related outer membrane protein [Bacteroidales bacterium]|nr:Omp28-related outer membrane protein [Bacteroidales bacterium]